jgi:transcriptional regulator with XRE-family HTH domain
MQAPSDTRFADNFARLLGVHRLSAKRAGEILGVSAASLSYWLNGRREPDRDSLYGISIFFLVDPWEIMEAPARDFVLTLADQHRFDMTERQIAEGVTAAELERAAFAKPLPVPGEPLPMPVRRQAQTARVGEVVDLMDEMREAIAGGAEERVSAPSRELRKLQTVQDEDEG